VSSAGPQAPPSMCLEGGRADRVVARVLGIGRRRARELIECGAVLIDGRRVRCADILESTASISLSEPPTADSSTPLAGLPRVVWEGTHVVGVNKPAGYHSHRGKHRPTIADFLAERHPGIEGVGDHPLECGLIHRLDRDTSGIIVAALDRGTFLSLRTAFRNGDISKDYLALVHGVLSSPAVVDTSLVRLRSRVRAARRGERALSAVTRVLPLEHGECWTLVSATMETGVTHQIRVHLAMLGNPVIGDRKYGRADNVRDATGGQRLHAWCIRLPGDVTLTAAPDGRFLETLAQLRARKVFA
jgi:23S rRNA pseudouridine1911/1915/1917 synthase